MRHAVQGRLALLPDMVEARAWPLQALDPLDEAEGPQLQQGGPPRQRFPDLPQQEDLGRAEQQEAPGPTPVGEQLDGVQQGRLLLDLVEDDQARAVVQAADGVGRQPEPLVRIVQGQVDRRVSGQGKQVAGEGGLSGLAGACQDRDRTAGEPRPEDRGQASRVEHGMNSCNVTAGVQGQSA